MAMSLREAAARLLCASLLLAPALACSSTSTALKPAGTSCGADSECAAGLSCLALGAFTDAGCTPAAKACSRVCTLDSDCTPLGPSFKCFAACDNTRSCGATQ